MSEVLAAAIQHHQAGRLQEAEALYRQILQAQPDHPDALNNLGLIAQQVGRYDAAVEYFSRAINAQPARADFHNNLGEVCRRWGKLDEALAGYQRALALSPGLLSAMTGIGGILKQQGRMDEAAAHYRRMLLLHPGSMELHNNLGNVLQEQGHLEEAVAQYRRALALRPDCAEVHNNMGGAFYDLGRPEEAVACGKEALRLKPEYAEAHWNNGRAQLLAGNFEEGWKEYSWRWWTELFRPWARRFPQPEWDGREDISGRTLLLHTEQGHGDAIQFIRYVPLVAKRATVIVECQPEMKSLLETVEGAARVVARGEPLPDFDLHLPLLSLPGVFGTTLETIPANVPYVCASPERVRAWRAKLAPDGRSLKVGLTWAGGRSDPKRDCALALLAPLAALRGVVFYSLQKGDAAEQAARPPAGMALIDRTAELKDFADTAALVSHLDLVISVDTSVAHLAGAMGRPVWTLLRFSADWRWLQAREDSPWYPTMRLFRQERFGDWSIVIERVRQALAKLTSP